MFNWKNYLTFSFSAFYLCICYNKKYEKWTLSWYDIFFFTWKRFMWQFILFIKFGFNQIVDLYEIASFIRRNELHNSPAGAMNARCFEHAVLQPIENKSNFIKLFNLFVEKLEMLRNWARAENSSNCGREQ